MVIFEYDFIAFKRIPHYILVGEKDRNDPMPYALNNDENKIKWLKSNLGENPYKRAVRFYEYLESSGISVKMTIYQDMEHIFPDDAPEKMFRFFDKVYNNNDVGSGKEFLRF